MSRNSRVSLWTVSLLALAVAVVAISAWPSSKSDSGTSNTGARSNGSATEPIAPSPKRSEMDQETKDRISAGRHYSQSWRTLDIHHRLTDDAVREAELDQKTVTAVQTRFDKLFEEQTEAFAKRAIFKENLSDPEEGILVYEIPATEDRGQIVREELASDLIGLVGKESANKLLASLQPPYFGFYGRLDVRVRFHPNPNPNPNPNRPPGYENSVTYHCIDPTDGQVTMSHDATSLDVFGRYFGTSLLSLAGLSPPPKP